ncbi:glutathione S-transferase family protein [Neptunicella marina]|uniref:Glutathione S-transferase n=1 Tax=Neptunicella marina TaxID=2125989 RepID=A0A8J6ITW6_9ALTE|nr:glutathione S-transferase [Neptunicella marina]MBC3765536.1 glutathione S-transferase [Neptunicella marina]
MQNSVLLYRHPLSGHSHRVQLFASLAGINHTLVDVDLVNAEHKQDAFLALNPLGQVPVIKDGDFVLADSNAILLYLARRYAPDYLADNALEEAQIQRYLSIAANEIANGPAAARLITVFGAPFDAEATIAKANAILSVLNDELEGKTWLVGNKLTIADIAIYSYLAHAPEGNVSLEPYPNVRAHLASIESLPGFVAMQATAAGLAA